jgi:hypothetical protein
VNVRDKLPKQNHDDGHKRSSKQFSSKHCNSKQSKTSEAPTQVVAKVEAPQTHTGDLLVWM